LFCFLRSKAFLFHPLRGKTLLFRLLGCETFLFCFLRSNAFLFRLLGGKTFLFRPLRRKAFLFRLLGCETLLFCFLRSDTFLFCLFGSKAFLLGLLRGDAFLFCLLRGKAFLLGLLGRCARFRGMPWPTQRRSFRPAIAQGFQTLGQGCGIGHVRHRRVELCHHMLGHGNRIAQRIAAFAVQRRIGAAHATDPDLQRRQHRRQRFDADHRDGAVQRVHRAHQFVIDAGVERRVTRQVTAHAVEMLADFGTQNVQQDRIDDRKAGHGRGEDRFERRSHDHIGRMLRFRQWHPAAHLAHDLVVALREILHPRGLPGGQLFGGLHDRVERRIDRHTGALQAGMQLRQRCDRGIDQRQHVRVGFDGLVEHAVEHVLDFPAEFTQRRGAHQPPGTLECVEGTPHVLQRVQIFRIRLPRRQVDVDVGDFLADFLDEYLADFLVDARGILERRIHRRAFAGDRFQDFFFDVDPLARTHAGNREGLGGGCGLHERNGCHDFDRCRCFRFHGLRRHHLRRLRRGRRLGDFNRLRRFATRRYRPIMQQLQAVLGAIQNAAVAGVHVMAELEVVLDAGHDIGELVHLVDRGNLAVGDQFVADVAIDAFHQAGRTFEVEDAQRAADFRQQARHFSQLLVRPRRLDECGDVFLDLAKVGASLVHQRAHDLARFAARQGVVRLGIRSEMLDVFVQRCIDVQQRAGNVEDGFRLGFALPVDHLDDGLPLLCDHPGRRFQPQHAERVADPVQHFNLWRELLRIAVFPAQEDVEAFLDAQKIFTDGLGNGIQQRTVAPGHRRARAIELRFGRNHPVQREALRNGFASARARRGLRDVIQERAGELARVLVVTHFLALVLHVADGAVEVAELLPQAGEMMIEPTLLQGFQHAARDPPQPSRGLGVTHGAQLVHAVAHLRKVRLLALRPGQQLHLETCADLGDALAQVGERIRRARAGRIGRQWVVEIGMEQHALIGGLLAIRVAQFIEQRQQDDRDVLVAAFDQVEIIGQLHETTHQGTHGLVAVGHFAVEHRLCEVLHFLVELGGAVQLDDAQRAEHLVQQADATLHRAHVRRVFGEGFKRLARLRQQFIDLRLDPAKGREVDVFFKSHRRFPVSTTRPPCHVTCGRVDSHSGGTGCRGYHVVARDHEPSRRQAGSLKSATDRRSSCASCARLPIDSAVWLAPTEVCAVIC